MVTAQVPWRLSNGPEGEGQFFRPLHERAEDIPALLSGRGDDGSHLEERRRRSALSPPVEQASTGMATPELAFCDDGSSAILRVSATSQVITMTAQLNIRVANETSTLPRSPERQESGRFQSQKVVYRVGVLMARNYFFSAQTALP